MARPDASLVGLSRPFTRRRLMTTSSAAALTLMSGGFGALAHDATPVATSGLQPDGSWMFTDDRGVTISLPEAPKRVVAQTTAAAALWDLGVQVVGVIGPNRLADGTNDFQAGAIDFDQVETLGDWGTDSLELDIEKLVELQPDLIVDMSYGDLFWYTETDRATLEKIAPIAGISMEKVSILTSIERFEDLATALGADLAAAQVESDRTVFIAAETALTTAIESKPGLTVLACSPGLDTVYICSPRWMTDLHYFQSLGLDILDHDLDEFFEVLSWEEINRYPADLILVDIRGTQSTTGELSEVATWKSLPAVQANQIGPWYAGAPYSRARLAPIMTELAGIITDCRTDLV